LAVGALQISDIQWSITGDRFLVAPAASQSAQAKCFDREGVQLYGSTDVTSFGAA